MVAVLGVFLGKRWEARGGHRAWLRDQRLIAYTTFLGADLDLYNQLGDTVPLRREHGDFDDRDVVDPLLDHLGAADSRADLQRQSLARIEVVGPESVIEAARACHYATNAYLDVLLSETWRETDLEQAHMASRKARRAFSQTARGVVGGDSA
ncbi:MAG TPA: hypothetical protein VF228_26040 [Iamia sp.]